MGYFAEVRPESGVDLDLDVPFMSVPARGGNLVFVKAAVAPSLRASAGLKLLDVTDRPVHSVLATLGNDGLGLALVAYVTSILIRTTDRLFVVADTGKGSAPHKVEILSKAKAPLQRLDVAVLLPKAVTLAFRYLRYRDSAGQMNRGTSRQPDDAAAVVDQLNAIYIPQANITFSLKNARMLSLAEHFGDTIFDAVYNAHLAREHDPDAAITVFCVGKWAHSRVWPANGSTFSSGAGHDVVLNDTIVRVGKGTQDPWLQTLAHEIAHALGYPGHESRTNVLTSTAVQSLKLSKDVVLAITKKK